MYLREEQLLLRLDEWLSRKFDPMTLPATVRELEAAQPGEPKPDEAAQREIAECDAKLRQHRAALEAGADPVLVTSWMKETQAKRAAAEARLQKPTGRRRMIREEITDLVTTLGDAMRVLKDADPADKTEIYGQLGLTLTYHPNDRRVVAEARPETIMYVGACPRGDLNPERRAISPILRLSTQVGEKSPSRGFHAAMVASEPRTASSGFRRLAAKSALPLPFGRDGACRPVGVWPCLLQRPGRHARAVPRISARRVAKGRDAALVGRLPVSLSEAR
jgi:hypothetical protein